MRISDWSSDVCSSDLCTVFLNDPADYDGGALHVELGSADLRFKEAPGVAVVYPSHTLHEVEPVTRGERLVAVTFIQSLIPDVQHRQLMHELNEVAALEGSPREQIGRASCGQRGCRYG